MIARKPHTSHTQNSPIYLNRRVVGRVRGDTFRKTLSKRKHFLRRPPAIAFDRSSLADARRAGAVRIHITDKDTGDTYEATIDAVEDGGFSVQRGFGDQVALPLNQWTVNGQEPAATFASNAAAKDAQLPLFGAVTE